MGDGQRPVVDYWVAKDSGDEGKFRTNVDRNPTARLTVPNGLQFQMARATLELKKQNHAALVGWQAASLRCWISSWNSSDSIKHLRSF
jgi:hypothetical protein